ncbi:MAG: cbb3-type cytochrome c oxidase subunit I [Candidatus Nitrospinota bacterium M3_3B_026]
MRFSFRSVVTAWLGVAVASMAFMGVYAFMIVLSRAPGFNLLFTEQDFFHTALVTHVVLSVVIWFQAFILFLIHYTTSGRPPGTLDGLSALGALAGVALIVVTPLTGQAYPMLNNYVPVLNRPMYITGLALFFGFASLGVVLRAPALAGKIMERARGGEVPLAVTAPLAGAGLSIVMGVALVVLALIRLSGGAGEGLAPTVYFEILFWGGGHVLQFANTFGMMAVWSLLALRLGGGALADDRVALAAVIIMAAFVVSAPVDYFTKPIESFESRAFFTTMKGWGIALGPIVLGLSAALRWKRLGDDFLARRGLALSMALFGMGGLIALTIQGSDTRIPAHYHGVIGGVTIGYMTLGLLAMRDNGWLAAGRRWLKIQVNSYGVGQALFVVGMFVGGLLGLARKTYGQAQVLDTFQKALSMALMGIGGVLAIAAGGLFVVIMIMSLARGRREA